MRQITRRQHYVWQYYLREWTTSNKVWVKRDNKMFRSSTKNIMVETDFYKIHKLNKLEKYIRDEILTKDKRPEVNEIVKKEMFSLDLIDYLDSDELSPLEIPILLTDKYGMRVKINGEDVDIKKIIESTPDVNRKVFDDEFKKNYKNFRIQHGEDLVKSDEYEGKKYLDMLLADDISFFDNSSFEMYDFYYFLMFKYLRTSKIKKIFIKSIHDIIKLVKENYYPELDGDAEKIFSHCFYALVTKASAGLSYDKNFKIMLMKSANKTFITSDQPVFNMNEVRNIDGQISEMQLYMPISPYKSVIIGRNVIKNQVVDADEKTVKFLNEIVVKNSHTTIVSKDKESLF